MSNFYILITNYIINESLTRNSFYKEKPKSVEKTIDILTKKGIF